MIEISLNGDVLTCKPAKDIVASNVPKMRDTLINQLDSNLSWNSLTLDCNDVEKLDSIGINLIVGLLKKTRGLNKKFKVIGCAEAILKVLRLFRLEEQFTIEGKNAN